MLVFHLFVFLMRLFASIFSHALTLIPSQSLTSIAYEQLPIQSQDISASCSEFSEYASLIGINTHCKMRWSGQWPQGTNAAAAAAAAVAGQQLSVVTQQSQQVSQASDMQLQQQDEGPIDEQELMIAAAAAVTLQQQKIDNARVASGSNDLKSTLMTIDRNLHTQIQQHLSAEQFDLLSQLKVS